jgi:stearoyl-CoA desaturase (Delta-9 desaturase)
VERRDTVPGSALHAGIVTDDPEYPGALTVEDLPPTASSPPPAVTSSDRPASGATAGRAITGLLVLAPLLGLALLVVFGWDHVIRLGDVVIAIALYLFTGFGVAAGLHRLFAHHSFKPNRALKVTLAIAGSMALEGSLISWVAIHRRHHMFSDQAGDPHSPYRYGSGFSETLRGLYWAHVGWLFADDPTDVKRFAPDLLRDKDLVVIDRLFPLFAIGSLAVPFALGWLIFGTLGGAFAAFFWAGLVRMALLHHVTWSINSVCHLWGRRPFATSDSSGNVAPLALVSFGESWHNFHHSAPASARHGVLHHQMDPAARLIRLFEVAGWATKVRWPSSSQIANLTIKAPVHPSEPTIGTERRTRSPVTSNR